MAGGTGRGVRIAVGIVLVGDGLYVQGAWGIVIARSSVFCAELTGQPIAARPAWATSMSCE